MNQTYVAPLIEVIEIEIEDALLQQSGVTLEGFTEGTVFGSIND